MKLIIPLSRRKNKMGYLFFIVALLFASLVSVTLLFYNSSYSPDVNTIIIRNKKNIEKYCKYYRIKPRIYVSVIYSELINNYNYLDYFDTFRARIGSDPSMGFAQIKLSTFRWIEDHFADGSEIIKSSSKEELINKINDDSTNIKYSCLYIKIIYDMLISNGILPSVQLIGSYYGKGVNKLRYLSGDYCNIMGKSAREFYDSSLLLEYFPK